MRSGLFGQRLVTAFTPNITYDYCVSASGTKHNIDMLLQQYAKQVPVPRELRRNFVNGERIILNVLKKTSNSDFEIQTIGKVLAEEYGMDSDAMIEEMNDLLFKEKKEGLLGKLAFDVDLTHEITSNNHDELCIKVENRKREFDGQIMLKRKDIYLPLYLAFEYRITGRGQKSHYERFLEDYWPSAQVEDT